jgi:hypothetical protein
MRPSTRVQSGAPHERSALLPRRRVGVSGECRLHLALSRRLGGRDGAPRSVRSRGLQLCDSLLDVGYAQHGLCELGLEAVSFGSGGSTAAVNCSERERRLRARGRAPDDPGLDVPGARCASRVVDWPMCPGHFARGMPGGGRGQARRPVQPGTKTPGGSPMRRRLSLARSGRRGRNSDRRREAENLRRARLLPAPAVCDPGDVEQLEGYNLRHETRVR